MSKNIITLSSFIVLFCLFPSIISIDIKDLEGKWTLRYCNEGQSCQYQFNYTIDFKVDNQKKIITNNVALLDGIKNSYDTFTQKWQYQNDTPNNYTLRPINNDNDDPFTLYFYNDEMAALYRILRGDQKPQYQRYEIFGIQKLNIKDNSTLLKELKKTFPSFSSISAGTLTQKLPFSVSPQFQNSDLNGKIWFVDAEWSSKKKVTEQEEKDPKSCQQAYFPTKQNHGIDSPSSLASHILAQTTWNDEKIDIKNVGGIYYPDPVINGWIHNEFDSKGIIYSSNNTLIEVQPDKKCARLYSINAQITKQQQALFNAKLISIGINPLNGFTTTYNNDICNPENFHMSDIRNTWDVTAIIVSENNQNSILNKSQACIINHIDVYEEEKTIYFSYEGYDMENTKTFLKTLIFTFKDDKSRYLYPSDYEGVDKTPYYIIPINRNAFVIQRIIGGQLEAISFQANLKGDVIDFNQNLLNQLYPGQEFLYSYNYNECSPLNLPIQNITTSDFTSSSRWYQLASYRSNEVLKNSFSCSKWIFTQNKKNPNSFNLLALAQNDYTVMEFKSSNALSPATKGYYLPKITQKQQDQSNLNKTMIFMNVQYWDGKNMIILNDDYENDIFEFYFISKGIEYTFNDENLFMNLVERIKGKLSESNYYVFDNDNCDYGEVERSEGDQGNSVRNDILRFLE